MNTKKIEIPRRNGLCAHCQQPLQPGTPYFSVLLDETKEGVYTRLDYKADCWKQEGLQQSYQKARSIWKAKVPLKKDLSELPKQRDARALFLLKESLANHAPESYAESFVLSLYLARRRKIAMRQESFFSDGHPASLYEVYETEEMLLVPKLALSNLEVEKIQLAIAAKLK